MTCQIYCLLVALLWCVLFSTFPCAESRANLEFRTVPFQWLAILLLLRTFVILAKLERRALALLLASHVPLPNELALVLERRDQLHS